MESLLGAVATTLLAIAVITLLMYPLGKKKISYEILSKEEFKLAKDRLNLVWQIKMSSNCDLEAIKDTRDKVNAVVLYNPGKAQVVVLSPMEYGLTTGNHYFVGRQAKWYVWKR